MTRLRQIYRLDIISRSHQLPFIESSLHLVLKKTGKASEHPHKQLNKRFEESFAVSDTDHREDRRRHVGELLTFVSI